MYKYIFQILIYIFIFYFYKLFFTNNNLYTSFNYNNTNYYTSRYYEYDSRAIRILLI